MAAAARRYSREPRPKVNSSTVRPSIAFSASTWSFTKPPRAGASGVGHRFVTTRTRIGAASLVRNEIVTHREGEPHTHVGSRYTPHGTIDGVHHVRLRRVVHVLRSLRNRFAR